MRKIVFLLILAAGWPLAHAAEDWSVVEKTLGRKGARTIDGAYKVAYLRTDVEVMSGLGMATPAELGLNSYAAFAGTLADATVVGDTCMLVHEIGPIIDALRDGGVEIVALHNHMLTDEPRLFFMHFQGRGTAAALARTVRKAWDELGKPPPAGPTPPQDKEAKAPNWMAVGKTMRAEGWAPRKDVWKSVLPRTKLAIELDGRRLPAGVGLACWAAFYACPCGLTKVMGDTCVSRSELQGVIDALRKGGVHISAIHNHLLGTSEPVMFVHVAAEGNALAIARTIRAAWDTLGE